MAKIIAWLVLIFVVLLALRIVNTRNAKARRASGRDGNPASPGGGAQPMVRCARCGVFLPRVEARPLAEGAYSCADGQCGKR